MAAVEAGGLVRRFEEVTALDGVDLEIREGEVFGLLGPNGAGKTTLVRILVTLLRPDAGSARVAGLDVLADPTGVRGRIGYVPQEVTADRYLTAREQLSLFADLYHLPREFRRRRIEELLDLVGLREAADRPARGYSGGMKKKLDLACGLVHDPPVLFLDEPSLGLDVASRRALWDHIAALRGRGVGILLCTNSMDEADRLCDRVGIIDRGRVVAIGTPAGLRAGLGGDVVTLEPEEGPAGGPDGGLARLETAFARMPLVRGMTREGARLHLYVDSNESALPRVIETASAAGVALRSVSYSRPGLEEVFLRATGHPFREGPAAAGAPAVPGREDGE